MTANAEESFVHEHQALVVHIARELRDELGLGDPLDDLIADGLHGLVEARSRFDETLGASFVTFAYYRIRGAMLDGVRRMGHLSRRAHYARRRARALDQVAEANPSPQSDPQVGEDLDATVLALQDVLGDMMMSATLAALPEEAERLASSEPSPELAVISEMERARLRRALAKLPEREHYVLRAIYFDEQALDDVGAHLGISRSRASRIHTRGLKLLREALG